MQRETFCRNGAVRSRKTTLVAALLAADPLIRLSVSYTTRAPREGEVDGKHYHFVRREGFPAAAAAGEFLESAEVYGNFYGTSQRWLQQQLDAGNDILLEIDWQGSTAGGKLFPDGNLVHPAAVVEVLEQRLRSRATDSEGIHRQTHGVGAEEITHVEDSITSSSTNDGRSNQDLISVVRAPRLGIPAVVACRFALFSP